MHSNHIRQIKQYRERGFSIHNIAALTGHKRSDVQRVLARKRNRTADHAKRLLAEPPAGCSLEEHRRIVLANFGEEWII